ncbi:Pkinase-domain-containing protein [Serendipita vermifera]|nr:Pkinase-domain-containing protein [Serendipita vermifera]
MPVQLTPPSSPKPRSSAYVSHKPPPSKTPDVYRARNIAVTPPAEIIPPKVEKLPTPVTNYQTRWQREKAKAQAEGADIEGVDPKMIGPWVIGEMLGRGASGRVRLARHVVTGKMAAVKILSLHPTLSSRSSTVTPAGEKAEKVLFAAEREIAVMKLLDHPNLMKMYDVWSSRKELYLVLEYVQGGELFDYLCSRGSRLPAIEAVSIIKQVLAGVDYCHRFNICHRDLKPENILLATENALDPVSNMPIQIKRVKIADFGMSALDSLNGLLRTSCGSPHYASPEIVKGERYSGAGSDIWSCGVILYALLTSRLPFDDPNVNNVLRKVRDGKFSIPEWVIPQGKDLIMRMLEVDITRRITMKEIFEHPLFHLETPGIILSPTPGLDGIASPVAPADIDTDLLRNLCVIWREKDKSSMIRRLCSDEKNFEKAFYFLLCRFRDRSFEEYNMDSSSHPSPISPEPLSPPVFCGSEGTDNLIIQRHYPGRASPQPQAESPQIKRSPIKYNRMRARPNQTSPPKPYAGKASIPHRRDCYAATRHCKDIERGAVNSSGIAEEEPVLKGRPNIVSTRSIKAKVPRRPSSASSPRDKALSGSILSSQNRPVASTTRLPREIPHRRASSVSNVLCPRNSSHPSKSEIGVISEEKVLHTSASLQRPLQKQRSDARYSSTRNISRLGSHDIPVQAGEESSPRALTNAGVKAGRQLDTSLKRDGLSDTPRHPKSPTVHPSHPRLTTNGRSFTPTRPLSKVIAAPTLFEQPRSSKPLFDTPKLRVRSPAKAKLESIRNDRNALDKKVHLDESPHMQAPLSGDSIILERSPGADIEISRSNPQISPPKARGAASPVAPYRKTSHPLEGLGVFLDSNSTRVSPKSQYPNSSPRRVNEGREEVPVEENKENEKSRVSSSSSKSSFSKFVSRAMDGRFSPGSFKVEGRHPSTKKTSGAPSHHESVNNESNSIGDSQWEKVDWVGELPADNENGRQDRKRQKRKPAPLELVNPYHKDRSLTSTMHLPIESDGKKNISSPLPSPFLGFVSSRDTSSAVSSDAFYGYQGQRGFFARLFDWRSPALYVTLPMSMDEARKECQNFLKHLNITFAPIENGSLRCNANEVTDDQGQRQCKPVRFRLDFYTNMSSSMAVGFSSSTSGGRSNDSNSGSSHYSIMESSVAQGDCHERGVKSGKIPSVGSLTSTILITQEKGALSTLKLVHQMMMDRWRVGRFPQNVEKTGFPIASMQIQGTSGAYVPPSPIPGVDIANS